MASPTVTMNRRLLSFAFFLLLACLVSSIPISAPTPQQTQEAPGEGLTWEVAGAEPGTIACETDRTSDYYGLGVRMGIYAAWVTSWIASNFVQDEIAGALDTNAIFLFALVIAVVRCTITDLTSRIDGLMLMHLSLGTVFSSNSVWGYRTCIYKNEGHAGIRHFGGFGTHLRLLLSAAVSVYGFWFWYDGVTGSLLTGEPPCNMVYTFFFGRLHVNSGLRIAYLVLFMACILFFGVMVLTSVLGPLMRISKMRFLIKYHFFRTSSRLRYATGLTYGQLKILYYGFSIFNLFWIVFTIISCEYTLQYNHIQSVLGENGRIFFPSQLIPFAIGISGLIRVIYLFFESWRSNDHTPSLGRTPTLPKRAVTIPRGRGLLKILAPATQPQDGASAGSSPHSPKASLENTDLDEEMVGQRLWWRLLVTYLPWLHPFQRWLCVRKQPAEADQDSMPGEQLEKVDSSGQDPERGKSSSKGRRATWGTERTYGSKMDDSDLRTAESSPSRPQGD